jgi:hypothetical protein
VDLVCEFSELVQGGVRLCGQRSPEFGAAGDLSTGIAEGSLVKTNNFMVKIKIVFVKSYQNEVTYTVICGGK